MGAAFSRPMSRRGIRRVLAVLTLEMEMIDKELLDLLACPLCKAALSLDGDWLVCSQCRRRYPIRDGIPVLLVEEAVLPDRMGAKPGDSTEAT